MSSYTIGKSNPAGEVVGFDHGRPLWRGPPFADADRYAAIVAFWKAGKVQKGPRPWWSPEPAGLLFYGPANALADLEAYGPKFTKGFAERQATLPASAFFMADAYSTGKVDRYPGSGGNPIQTDEFGRAFQGVSASVYDQVLALGALVAPYIPGWGPVLVAAIAVAQGKQLDDAILASIKSYIPGGPMAGLAFDFGVAVAMGEPVDAAALRAAVSLTPEGALAYSIARTAMGDGLDAAAVQFLKERYPYEAALIEQNPVAWLAKQPGGAEAVKKGAAAPPLVMLSSLRSSSLIKAKTTAAPTKGIAQVLALAEARDPIVRAHRATVADADRSWPIAAASLGLVPLAVVVARVVGELAARKGWG